MTAVLDSSVDGSHTEVVTAPPLATWPARVGAFAVDVLLPVAVLATLAVCTFTASFMSWLWWVYMVALAVTFLAAAVNRLLLPTMTGFSLGRALFGVAVRTRGGAPAGVWRLLLRDMAHLLDTVALFVGWLWPLWDRRRRTFADMLLRTEVHKVDRPDTDVRKATAIVLVAATVVCAVAVGLGYLVVYRPQGAVEAARQQVEEQGPRIVEQMLSYKKETLQQDFSHAQSLTTDAYRPQLIAQQQAVQEAGPTSNEYWAVSSAVLPNPPVTTDRAAMLVALQGQRGVDPKDLKFITATVRVDFEKVDGQWRVDNLTVLKKPLMNVAGQ